MTTEYYAEARWSEEDVHNHREESELDKWTDERAKEFLSTIEERIRAAMIIAGWRIIESEMENEVEEEVDA